MEQKETGFAAAVRADKEASVARADNYSPDEFLDDIEDVRTDLYKEWQKVSDHSNSILIEAMRLGKGTAFDARKANSLLSDMTNLKRKVSRIL